MATLQITVDEIRPLLAAMSIGALFVRNLKYTVMAGTLGTIPVDDKMMDVLMSSQAVFLGVDKSEDLEALEADQACIRYDAADEHLKRLYLKISLMYQRLTDADWPEESMNTLHDLLGLKR